LEGEELNVKIKTKEDYKKVVAKRIKRASCKKQLASPKTRRLSKGRR